MAEKREEEGGMEKGAEGEEKEEEADIKSTLNENDPDRARTASGRGRKKGFSGFSWAGGPTEERRKKGR